MLTADQISILKQHLPKVVFTSDVKHWNVDSELYFTEGSSLVLMYMSPHWVVLAQGVYSKEEFEEMKDMLATITMIMV